MTFFYFLVAVFMILSGAIFGRMDGGGIVKTSEWFERSLVMFYFVLACSTFANSWALMAFAGMIGIATGHGQYFLSRAVKAVEPEKVDFILSYLFGDDPRTKAVYAAFRGDQWNEASQTLKDTLKADMEEGYGMGRLYWRNVAGMGLTGALVGLPAFIICMIFGQWYGALFLLTGPVKAASYMIGSARTETAEYLNGGGRSLICFTVIYFFLNGAV